MPKVREGLFTFPVSACMSRWPTRFDRLDSPRSGREKASGLEWNERIQGDDTRTSMSAGPSTLQYSRRRTTTQQLERDNRIVISNID